MRGDPISGGGGGRVASAQLAERVERREQAVGQRVQSIAIEAPASRRRQLDRVSCLLGRVTSVAHNYVTVRKQSTNGQIALRLRSLRDGV